MHQPASGPPPPCQQAHLGRFPRPSVAKKKAVPTKEAQVADQLVSPSTKALVARPTGATAGVIGPAVVHVALGMKDRVVAKMTSATGHVSVDLPAAGDQATNLAGNQGQVRRETRRQVRRETGGQVRRETGGQVRRKTWRQVRRNVRRKAQKRLVIYTEAYPPGPSLNAPRWSPR